jgi:hypothetical protein
VAAVEVALAGAGVVDPPPGFVVPAATDGVMVKESWNCTGNGQPALP